MAWPTLNGAQKLNMNIVSLVWSVRVSHPRMMDQSIGGSIGQSGLGANGIPELDVMLGTNDVKESGKEEQEPSWHGAGTCRTCTHLKENRLCLGF